MQCAVKKHVTGRNEVSVIKTLKDKKGLIHEPEKSTVTFHFIANNNGQTINRFCIIVINHIEFFNNTNEDFSIGLFPRKYSVQCEFIGYYTSKLKLKIEKGYDYKIAIKFKPYEHVILY